MNDEQWTQLAAFPDDHRRAAALELLRQQLPAHEPTRGWANFEFIALDGNRFDVDVLILTAAGIVLVELAPYRGHLDIGTDIWLHTRQNRAVDSIASPRLEASRKAAKLHGLLESVSPSSHRIPPIQPLVFVSEQGVDIDIDAGGEQHLAFHPDADTGPSVIDALVDGDAAGLRRLPKPLSARVARRFLEAFDNAEPEDRRFTRTVGDYQLGELIDSTDHFQDYFAEHRSTGDVRRARIFRTPRGASDTELERIQEAARREFDLLSELDHDGVLQATRHIGHERRPAVLYEAPDGAVRLDHYIAREERIGPATRYALLEAIVEAVRFAHEHRVIHRALSPRSVLVVPGEGDSKPSVRLLNWHTGRREEHETGTRHVSDYVDSGAKVYLAPELAMSPDVGTESDVFGLGTLAYFLFTGHPPATDLSSLNEAIRISGGLAPSAQNDNVGPELDDLVLAATAGEPDDRPTTAGAFHERLEAIRDRVVATDVPPDDPRDAREGDVFGPYTIRRRLGRGSTATAVLADDADGQPVVLKIANDDTRHRRIREEARALREFDTEIIVDFYELTKLRGHDTLVMQYAGDTLLDELRNRAALSLDDQRRFGADICEICCDLEDAGIFHRDIKPANIGVARPRAGSGRRRAILFDFSLHGVDIDNLDVGTSAYRDPFLDIEGRSAWDAHADRYSAALVLHEMVTKRLPQWGGGRVNPAVAPSVELHLEVERFPASIRDALTEFFETALAADHGQRFDTAGEMARAWRDIYRRTEDTSHGDDEVLPIDEVRPDDRLARLDVSQLALDSLDTHGVSTVHDLLRLPINKIQFLKGAGGEVRGELKDLHQQLAGEFPGVVADAGPADTADVDYSQSAIEKIFDSLKRKPADFEYRDNYAGLIRDLFCHGLHWSSWETIAEESADTDGDIQDIVNILFEKWRRKRSLQTVRDDIVDIIDEFGGIAVSSEIARTLLGERGSLLEGHERMNQASAVTRAAVETELATDNPRLVRLRHGRAESGGDRPSTFVATRAELLDLVPELGRCADELADRDTVPSSTRIVRRLLDVVEQAGFSGLASHRLLSIAAAASERAAVSSQDEIYPVGMSARRALNLCSNLLLRREPLTEQGVVDAVRDRYPDAEPLPPRPRLDDVLDGADVDLVWKRDEADGEGRFVSRHRSRSGRLAITRSTRGSWPSSGHTARPVPEQQARFDEFHSLVDFKSRDGGFFTLTVEPRMAADAATQLAADLDLEILSIDAVVVDVLKERADARNVVWDMLLEADAPEAPAGARQNMMRFLKGEDLVDRVYRRICDAGDRLLLTDPGLLGRWDDMAQTMDVLQRLRGRNNDGGPSICWLVVPASSAQTQSRPRIAGVAVPVDKGDYTRIPAALIRDNKLTG